MSNKALYLPGIDSQYLDPSRAKIHSSRDTGWLSDPKGRYYFKGEWHLMFQGFSKKKGCILEQTGTMRYAMTSCIGNIFLRFYPVVIRRFNLLKFMIYKVDG